MFLMKAPLQHCVQYDIVPTQAAHYKYVKSNHLNRKAVFQPHSLLHFSGLLLVGLIKNSLSLFCQKAGFLHLLNNKYLKPECE